MLNRYSRLLVVDDSATMRKLLAQMLASLGFDLIDQAADGLSALRKLNTHRYALVISDWNMQPMNGTELLSAIRTSGRAEMPFIMMTAHAVRFAEVAREGGVVHYLVKPFNSSALAAKLEAVAGHIATSASKPAPRSSGPAWFGSRG